MQRINIFAQTLRWTVFLFRFTAFYFLTNHFVANGASEFRGLWVDAFHSGFKNSLEVRQLVEDARKAHFNALLVEVRKRGDAYYKSTLIPKASDIAADYDPLADLIEQAHSGNPRLEVHAWTVMYPIWNSEKTSPTQPTHVYNQHRDWLLKDNRGGTWDGSNYQLDPGHPLVQDHLFNMAMELITRYDIDGLHFDYIRYPGSSWGYNETALQRYHQLGGTKNVPAYNDPAWMQFRRNQVTALVRRIYLNGLAVKPRVKISAATITQAPGISSDTQWPASAAFSNVMQDWVSWMKEGILDLNIPMAYFRQTSNSGDWGLWNTFAKNHAYQRQVAIGVGAYLNSASNALYQFRFTRAPTTSGKYASGLSVYSYANLCTNATRETFLNALVKPSAYDPQPTPFFFEQADLPDMPWKTNATTGHLLGYVRWTPDNSPVDGASVEITGPVQRSTRSDAAGFYGFVDLPAGNYGLRVYDRNSGTNQSQFTIQSAKVALLDHKITGTNPMDIQSQFALHIEIVANENVAVHFHPAYTNRTYQLLKASSLESQNWELLPLMPWVNPETGQGEFSGLPISGQKCFYKVQVIWK